jgi:hypothetical protein
LVLHLLYWLLCLCYSVHLLMLLQLHSVQAAFANGGATQVRSFAKDAAPADRPPVSGDGKLLTLLFCVSYWLKNCFGHVCITIMYMCLNSNCLLLESWKKLKSQIFYLELVVLCEMVA